MKSHQLLRHGHAPGHLRQLFESAVRGDLEPEEEGELARLAVDAGQPNGLRWLVGQLWNCTDTMPCDLCDLIGVGAGSTYAAGAQVVRCWDTTTGSDT